MDLDLTNPQDTQHIDETFDRSDTTAPVKLNPITRTVIRHKAIKQTPIISDAELVKKIVSKNKVEVKNIGARCAFDRTKGKYLRYRNTS